MGSEQNDSTSFTQSQASEPKLCARGCGFFGSPSNMDLCSKCYRSLCAEETQTVVVKAAVDKSYKTSSSPSLSLSPRRSLFITEPPALKPEQPDKSVLVAVAEPSSAARKEEEEEEEEEEAVPVAVPVEKNEPSRPARPNRCLCCNKKVGIMGFKCRCGSTFCGEHRYPESHDCTFDFKEKGRGEIAKANPLVKADKLQRF